MAAINLAHAAAKLGALGRKAEPFRREEGNRAGLTGTDRFAWKVIERHEAVRDAAAFQARGIKDETLADDFAAWEGFGALRHGALPVAAVYDRRKMESRPELLLQPDLGLGMTGELAFGSRAGQTFAARCPTAIDDRATALGGHAGQEAELADTTLLGGLERSFHGKC